MDPAGEIRSIHVNPKSRRIHSLIRALRSLALAISIPSTFVERWREFEGRKKLFVREFQGVGRVGVFFSLYEFSYLIFNGPTITVVPLGGICKNVSGLLCVKPIEFIGPKRLTAQIVFLVLAQNNSATRTSHSFSSTSAGHIQP